MSTQYLFDKEEWDAINNTLLWAGKKAFPHPDDLPFFKAIDFDEVEYDVELIADVELPPVSLLPTPGPHTQEVPQPIPASEIEEFNPDDVTLD